jgi:hydrogenase maturation protease
MTPRVLVAGVGNVLRGDDGFGPAVAAALEQRGGLPAGAHVVDVGIAGVRLVQELMDGYDALIIIDAVERGERPGRLFMLEPELPDLDTLPADAQRLLAGDMHQLVPERVLAIAAALDVLPPVVRIVGCQPEHVDDLVLEMTPAVEAAVAAAVSAVRTLVALLADEARLAAEVRRTAASRRAGPDSAPLEQGLP